MLKAEKLCCGYGRNFQLKDISFSLAKGEFAAIIGPNGSGKTTLLRALSKALSLTQGAVYLEEENISGISLRNLSKKIAVVNQEIQVQFEMSVHEFVALGRIPHQDPLQFFESPHDEKIITEALELTGTAEFKDRQLQTLSGGERQLVMIAKAIAQEPKLLLLDEPVAFLDIAHQAQILELIRKLNRTKNITVLIVMHELNLASEFCGRLLLFNRGRLAYDGSPQNILTPEIISEIYQTKVLVSKNPASGRPFLLVLSGETTKEKI